MAIHTDYNKLTQRQRRNLREEYVRRQKGKCFYCEEALDEPAPERVTEKKVNWNWFPTEFLKHPIHLQHDHDTGMTEGAVHAYCNAVMWQYEGR